MQHQQLSKTLIKWYQINKRDLPWRETNDAYKIWISEIILQQTRVNQGLGYYLRFIERFPTVVDLANAEEDEVLKYWQGLGYYSRARNLYKSAHQIVDQFDGKFPTCYDDILKLSGIGTYTASAICSFAYHQPYAVVDGNVYRVLSRIFGIDKAIDSSAGVKLFANLVNEVLDRQNPGLHNQAIMEFGALHCVPVLPDCNNCPLKADCRAFELNLVSLLPVKEKKVKVKNRYFNYLFIDFNGTTFLQKRTANDIWKNLYEFPLIETDVLLQNPEELAANGQFKTMFEGIENVNIVNISAPVKHILTHRIINAGFIHVRISESNRQLSKLIRIPFDEIHNYAVSKLIESYLESNQYINL